MKTRNLFCGLCRWLGILILLWCLSSGGQTVNAAPALPELDSAIALSEPPAPEPEGGGFWNPETDSGMSDALWNQIMGRARANEAILAASGKLLATNPNAAILFSLPVRWNETTARPVYYSITKFYNHGNSVTPIDFKNKGRSYDDHRGTDYLPFPFPWNMMDDSAMAVIAAADGQIVERASDRDDHNCTLGGPDNPNYILLKHADDTYTIYLHMEKDSLTNKGVGEYVSRGEFLGLIGSSGRSTAPHLHFEWRQAADSNPLDPFRGPGNPMLTESRWISQESYYVSRTLDMATSKKTVTMPDCSPGTLERQNVFARGDTVSFAAFFRDLRPDKPALYQIFRPDGSLFRKWVGSVSSDTPAGWWWIQRRIPGNAPLGKWNFQVDFAGRTTIHPFQVCNAAPPRPKLSEPPNGATVSALPVLFRWQANDCTETYNITVYMDSKTGIEMVADSGIRETEYTAPLVGGHTYWWRIEACNQFGCTKSRWGSFNAE